MGVRVPGAGPAVAAPVIPMDPMILASAAVVVIGAVAAAAVAIIKQLQAIHLLVNSAASKAAEKLVTLESTVAGLHATVAALQSQRVVDAQRTTNQAQVTERPAQAPVVATQVVEHQVVDRQSIKKGTDS